VEPAKVQALQNDMVRLADGDRSASRPVFDALWPVLVSFAERLVGADAADVAQEAMKRVFEQASDFDKERSALGWALAICGWECRTVLAKRRRRREAPLEPAEVERATAGAALEAEDRATLTRALNDAIATLQDTDQHTLRAAFLERIDDEACDLPGATFRERKERALGRLRAAWRKLYET